MNPLTFALGAGRLAKEVFSNLTEVVDIPSAWDSTSRSLIMETPSGKIRFLLIRNRDIFAILNSGGADLGIIGLDLLLENSTHAKDLTYPFRFNFSHCRLSIACQTNSAHLQSLREKEYQLLPIPFRVATKYPNLTRSYFAKQGIPVDIIKLNGSVEVAPRIGLAHCIVDLVSTGETLEENQLTEVTVILDSQAILLVRRGSYAWHYPAITDFIEKCHLASKIR